LESSDVDGGSSVAVLTYLRRILEALDHPDMIHLILHYLLALPDTTTNSSTLMTSISAARRQKSMDLATMMASHEELTSTPALFNLVDLIQGSLRSQSQQTISVTLQLVSVILRRHHRYAVTTLLWTSLVMDDGPQRTIGAHEKEMDFLLSLAGDIGGEFNFDEAYEDHVKDIMGVLESHLCSMGLVAPKSSGGTTRIPGAQATIPGAPRDVRPHTLRPEDPMMKTFVTILGTFFTNSVETNLSLTGAIVDLATCGYMRIDGWLLPDLSEYIYEEDEKEEEEEKEEKKDAEDAEDALFASLSDEIEIQERAQLKALKRARRAPKLTESNIPPLLLQLKILVEQVTTYRNEIPRFDDLLQQRRDAFQAASSTADTPPRVRHAPPRSSFESPSRSASPPRNPFDSLAHRIFPELGTPSRSDSPRGRRSQDRSSGLGGNYSSATPARSAAGLPPPQFPTGRDASSRSSSEAFSTSHLGDSDDRLGTLGVPASQAAAFAVVDQSILARRVGLPTRKGELHPIPFPNLRALGTPEAEGDTEASPQDTVDGSDTPPSPRSPDGEGKEEKDLVSVSHVLTNVIVLQEFLLELAAMVQVRAGLFDEVRFV
jgi:hypothetical protein